MRRSYTDQLQKIVEHYRDAGLPWPATTREIARWAIKNNEWQAEESSIVRMCADDLSSAMRQEFHTDEKGRRVRTKHAAKFTRKGGDGSERQMTFWHDMRTAPREFMERAFSQRRSQIVGDCVQLKNDVDSFNETRCPGNPIQMVFDFNEDLAEMDFVEVPEPRVASAFFSRPTGEPERQSHSTTRRATAVPKG